MTKRKLSQPKHTHKEFSEPIKQNDSSIWRWLHHSTFALILVLAFIVRFWKLGQIPFSLYWDEIAMYVDVKSVLSTGHDVFGRPWFQVIYPSYGDYKLPVLIWAATAAAKIFGLSEWSLRLPSALAGMGTIVVAGSIAKELLKKGRVSLVSKAQQEVSDARDKWLGLVQLSTMAVVAFSPWSIMFSRTGFEGHLGQFFLALSLLCFLKSRRNSWYILLVPFFAAVATYSYFSVRFVWIGVFLLSAIIIGWRQRNLEKKLNIKNQIFWFIRNLIFPLIFFSILLLPMLKSPLYKDSNTFRLGTDSILKNDQQVIDSNIYREMAGNTRVDRIIFHRMWLTTRELLKNYSDHLSLDFLFLSGDPNLRHGTGQYGLFVFPLILCFFLGLYILGDQEKEVLLLLFGWWMFALLPASVPETTPHALRSLNALVPLAIIIGTGLAQMILFAAKIYREKNTTQKFKRGAELVTITIFFLFLSISTITFLYHYFTVYPIESAKSWQNGMKQLALQLTPITAQQKVYLLPFDDHFYLWMMGYGPYTGKDFQSWKSVQYKFEHQVPNMIANAPSDADIATSGEVIIAGQPEEINTFIKEKKLSVVAEDKVLGDDGSVRFLITAVKK